MESDGGGWTLFLNYVHFPGSEFSLKEGKIPQNVKQNSHAYLRSEGFNEVDVKELRFLCTEKLKENAVYWHFKTSGEGFLQTALTGNQKTIKVNSK
jgi:hypothetical protein